MLTVIADCYVIYSQRHCACEVMWGSLHLLMYRPDSVLVCSQQCFGHSVTKTQRNSHAQSYMHPGVLGTIQIRAGSLVYRTGCERGRAVRGRSVLWILMSGRVVGIEWNNRASLCSTLHPSHTQGRRPFPRASPPFPLQFQGQTLPLHPPPHQTTWHSLCGLLIILDSMLGSPQGWRSDPQSHLNEEVLHSY